MNRRAGAQGVGPDRHRRGPPRRHQVPRGLRGAGRDRAHRRAPGARERHGRARAGPVQARRRAALDRAGLRRPCGSRRSSARSTRSSTTPSGTSPATSASCCTAAAPRSPAAARDASLYDFNLATYDTGDTFDQSNAKGFIEIYGLTAKLSAARDVRFGNGVDLSPVAGRRAPVRCPAAGRRDVRHAGGLTWSDRRCRRGHGGRPRRRRTGEPVGRPVRRRPRGRPRRRCRQSTHFDWRLAPHDIAGSVAHARVLHGAGLLTDAELDGMVDALEPAARRRRERRLPAGARRRGRAHRARARPDRARRARPRRQAARRPVAQRPDRHARADVPARAGARRLAACCSTSSTRWSPRPGRSGEAPMPGPHAPAARAAGPARAPPARARLAAAARRRAAGSTGTPAPRARRTAPARSPARRSASTRRRSPRSSASTARSRTRSTAPRRATSSPSSRSSRR